MNFILKICDHIPEQPIQINGYIQCVSCGASGIYKNGQLVWKTINNLPNINRSVANER